MVDPGHIILNYAHSMGPSFYAVGNAALKRLEPNAHAVGVIRTEMTERLGCGYARSRGWCENHSGLVSSRVTRIRNSLLSSGKQDQ